MIFGAAAIGMHGAFAADPAAAQYKADKSKADADYKAAKKKCGPLKGNDKDVCDKQAKADHESALADAKAKRKGAEADKDARKDKNDANYDVAKEKCDALSGDARTVCGPGQVQVRQVRFPLPVRSAPAEVVRRLQPILSSPSSLSSLGEHHVLEQNVADQASLRFLPGPVHGFAGGLCLRPGQGGHWRVRG
jgi:hypothetical protein